MINEILHPKQFRVPVTLKIGLGARPILVNFVLVRVNQGNIRSLFDLGYDEGERVWREEIVLIKKSDPLTSCQGQRRIGTPSDLAILISKNDIDTRVTPGYLIQ